MSYVSYVRDAKNASRFQTTLLARGVCAASIFAAAASFAASPGTAASATGNVLRVCAAKNAAPFSSEDGSGFENRIAAVVAAAMDKELKTVWLDKPAIYLVRDSLDKDLCDVVMGLDFGDARVLSSKPYYRTGYVFITRADRHLDISSWNDKRLLTLNHFAVSFDSPGEEMLKQIGKYDDNLNYNYSLVNFKSRRNQYVQVDPARMVAEVASGNADIAIAFAPEVARYVKKSSVPLRITLIADDAVRGDHQKVPQQFSQSAGVRKNDPQLLARLDAALAKSQPEIRKILDEEGIPLTSDAGGISAQGKHAAK
jgi:mxaJ protein